jgi:uncharacterized protein
MTTSKAFIKKHSLLIYFLLTFAISWGGFIFAVGLDGIPATPEQFTSMPLGVILAVLLGPSISGILMTGLVYGKEGYSDLFIRMRKWRVSAGWYVVALLTAPVVFTAVLFPLRLISPVFLPGLFASETKVSFVLMGIVAGLVVGLCEELGWTGFATPKLLKLRYSVLGAGLIVGVLWGGWHLLGNDIWASVATAGGLPPVLFAVLVGLVLLVGQLPAYRILMIWVYDRTESLLLAILMHASLAACTFILGPLVGAGKMSGASLLAYVVASAAATWLVVAVVTLVNRGKLSSHLLRKQMA